MKFSFIGFVAYRYFRSRRKSKGVASTILSVLGVAVGVMTLTTVLAVMNGFQLGFIESILQISSYDLQISVSAGDPLLSGRLEAIPDVEAVVPFAEQQAIIQGVFEAPRGCLIRSLPADVAQRDPGFMDRLILIAGSFDLEQPGSIVLGIELARHLGISVGDVISIMSLDGDSFSQLEPMYERYLVTGLFKCGYYEYDLGLGFIPLVEAKTDHLTYGVKIRDRFKDQRVKERINNELNGQYPVASWRDFNQAFFRALRMEKMLMMVLIGLIFVVVGFNIYHSLRRTVRERYEEIGVLKALGATQQAIQSIFVAEGLLIGLLGGFVGMVLGLLISGNINQVFSIVESLGNFLVGIVQRLAAPLLQGQLEQVSFFSPSYFYISEVPSRVLLHEAVFIYLFPLFSSTAAALMASRRIAEVRPAEVLRYE